MPAYRKFAYVYDTLMEDMPYGRWLAFAEQAWERYGKPLTVAELGCGTGSITIPLANEGYHVTGIDLSEDMLAVAQNKLGTTAGGQRLYRGGSVRLIRQDMRALELPEPVDAVISFCDCINYILEQSEVAEVFARTYDQLKPGGTFLFDVHHPRTLQIYNEEQPFVLDDPSVSYIWTCDFEEERCEIEHHLSIFAREPKQEGGDSKYERFEEVHVQRAYDPKWIEEELLRAGFNQVECYADFEWNLPDENTERVFFVAVK